MGSRGCAVRLARRRSSARDRDTRGTGRSAASHALPESTQLPLPKSRRAKRDERRAGVESAPRPSRNPGPPGRRGRPPRTRNGTTSPKTGTRGSDAAEGPVGSRGRSAGGRLMRFTPSGKGHRSLWAEWLTDAQAGAERVEPEAPGFKKREHLLEQRLALVEPPEAHLAKDGLRMPVMHSSPPRSTSSSYPCTLQFDEVRRARGA